ncbi:MAG: amidohydrolase [Acidaminococcus sp.]|jgi:5-methylthioadenosine/S-adenosylhomocysteine deaminase|nr:amidohydrolase [Acidaminococcus sp.]MCI2099443.1 amidohydrolase [Acidaminococcus sp.]MCI2113803.1 amidohydrolase [Acidaminococcus sp.]MCI2115623.1 amidohydrolase [Acidaminococcus sp.]
MTYDVVIKNTEILDKNDGKTYSIGIKDGKIAYIGTEPAEGTEVIDGTNHLAVPGFVNAHTHVAMTLFRSYADDLVLMDWLQNHIWPMENNLDADAVYWGSLLGIAEMLRTGTTCFADMYFFMEDTARAAAESGIRAVLSRGLTGSSPEDGKSRLEENTALYKNWHGKCSDRIHVMYGPHAPYTCTPDYIKSVIAEASRMGAEIHMHLSETEGEVKECIKKYGKTPIALMEELGLFELGTLAAHCVHVTDDDMDIMARHHVRVAHNPQSNLKLASGVAPTASMLAKNITVGLGTDGASSNNNLDMLEEVRLAAFLAKTASGDPKAVPAREAVAMGTVYGAQAVGMPQLGRIEKGWKADIALYDMTSPEWYPRNDRYSLLAYAASSHDVDHVLVDGKLLYAKGEYKTIDIEKVCAKVEESLKRMKAKA